MRRLLVIAFRALGDMVLVTPALRALKQRSGGGSLTLLVDGLGAEVFHQYPWVDELIVFDRAAHRQRPWRERLAADRRLVRRLRRARFDVAVDLFVGPRSAWLAWVSGATRRYGQRARGRAWLYTDAVDVVEAGQHLVDQKLQIIRPLIGDSPVNRSLELAVAPEELAWADEALRRARVDGSRTVVGLFPGGGWGHKCWPAERFAALADRVAGSAQVLVVGGVRDRDACQRVAAAVKHPVVVFDGLVSLRQTMALIARTNVFVSNDTGPMHVAVALGRPTIALFGPSDITKYGPWGPQTTVIRHALPCSPCPQQEDTCHLHGRVRQECMTLITVEEVEASVRTVLAQAAASLQVSG